VPKSDFAPWLKNNGAHDEALAELKRFAEAHPAEWPYHSNRVADYVRTVLNAHDPKEDALLTSLERYFLTWQNTGKGWQLWSAEAALVAAGLVVAIVVGFALFYTNLIDKLASPGSARGLITFLFSFITISVILIVIIALLWMDKDEDLDNRFTKAKDIIAILVGILGTIVGFYFGSNPTGPPTAGVTQPAAVSSTNAPIAARPGAASPTGAGAPAGATNMGSLGVSPGTPQEASPMPNAAGSGPATPENAPVTPR
jgi:hypothetical protein